MSALNVGDVLIEREVFLTRDSLVRYAGASGDFNPIHYRDDIAKSVGLDGVLAHGMLTMGLAISPVQSWLAGKGQVLSYQVRFTKPVYVPAEGSVGVRVMATVHALHTPGPGQHTLSLNVTTGDQSVLGKAFVVVSLS